VKIVRKYYCTTTKRADEKVSHNSVSKDITAHSEGRVPVKLFDVKVREKMEFLRFCQAEGSVPEIWLL